MFRAGFLLCIVAIGVFYLTGQPGTVLADGSSGTGTGGGTSGTGTGGGTSGTGTGGGTSGTGTGGGTALNPVEFSCDSQDGTITVDLGQNTSYRSLYAVGVKRSKAEFCNVKDQHGKFEISGCDPDNPITVILMKIPNQNQNTGRNNSDGSERKPKEGFVVGGEQASSYTLECFMNTAVKSNENIPHNFVVHHSFQLSTQLPNMVTMVEYGAIIDMNILGENGASLTGAATIGQKLLVIISGPDGPWYRVEECIAYENTRDDNTTIKLIVDSKAADEATKALMSDFKALTASSKPSQMSFLNTKVYMQSTMHAFHFRDGNSVTIECATEVCKSQDKNTQNCSATNSFGHASSAGRKRRDTNSWVHILKSTLVVNDHLENNGVNQKSSGDRHGSSYRLTLCLAGLWIVGILIRENLLM